MIEHVIAVDAECSCGEVLKGAWSGDEVDSWHESHADEDSEQEWDKEAGRLTGR